MNVIPWDGKPINVPGIYSGVPMRVYHGADLCVGPSISSSGLRRIFTDSAMQYWVYSPYNPNALEEPQKEAYILGRAAHHLVLGEQGFSRQFVARPERYPPKKHDHEKNLWWRETKEDQGNAWSSNADWCRAWVQVAEHFGWTILTPSQIDSIRGMAGLLPWQEGIEDCGLRNSAIVRAGALSGLVEHTIIAQDQETGVWLKARPDCIPLDSTEANDFKTTQAVTDRAIQKTLDDFRYDMQADLTATCLEQAADVGLTSFALIFAMKGTPHATRVVEMKPSDLAEAAEDNRTAIRTFARCLDKGRWPGPGGSAGDAAFIERSTFSRERAANRRAFLEMELEAA
jgi:hypothetical protein